MKKNQFKKTEWAIVIILLLLITASNSFSQTTTNLPKCGKYNLHLKNGCHWLLASKTKWILGYVVIIGKDTEYYDINGNDIDKTEVLGYGRLQRRRSKKKCYKPEIETTESCLEL